MYSLNLTVGELRTKMREQFERHRYVKQLSVVDMLLFQSHAEYQVRIPFFCHEGGAGKGRLERMG
jgi:NADH dehydrogenase (ubiquinone) 1 alpha subcomplex subunit 6